ncbi:SigB/SigF/SigG family RNA polymerase sigma factor [Streptomyces sp. Da 82-17]|uniref:SigB/SigF/SigG family RNA polymerase sigma factor n=1 Tax=Streptomyces sp. Da 82-17 TaxID=3377116 RepID=UPI0038D40B99
MIPVLAERTARAAHRPRRRGRRRRHDAPSTQRTFDHFHRLAPGPERDVLLAELAEAWLPMAHRIARSFRDKGEAIEDLQQIAALGLVKAIERYDPRRGPFEAYAVPTVTGEIRRHFRDRTWDVHVPRHTQDLRNTVRKAHRELSQQPGGQEPTVSQLARHTGLSEESVREGQRAMNCYSALSLDTEPVREDGLALRDTLGATDPAYDTVVDRVAARSSIRRLPRRERTVLYLRFFEGQTQSRIAEQLGVSQMQVSRLIAQTCARIRDEVARGADRRSHDAARHRTKTWLPPATSP